MRPRCENVVKFLLHLPIVFAVVFSSLIVHHLSKGLLSGDSSNQSGSLSGRALHETPRLQGINFSFSRDKSNTCSLYAEKISVRDRRYKDAVFPSFKDVVISHASVYTHVQKISEFLNWVQGPDIYFLAGLVLANTADLDDLSTVGFRLVIEDLEVHVAQNGQSSRLVLSAERMLKEAGLDETAFEGRLVLHTNPTERIESMYEGRWTPPGAMYFPRGCLINEAYREVMWWIPDRGADTVAGEATVSGRLAGKISGGPTMLLGRDSQEIRRLIAAKNHRKLKKLFLQYLVLNPEAVRPAGIIPMMMFGPGFKLGEFKPVFLSGMEVAGQSDPSARPQSGINPAGVKEMEIPGLMGEMLDFFLDR